MSSKYFIICCLLSVFVAAGFVHGGGKRWIGALCGVVWMVVIGLIICWDIGMVYICRLWLLTMGRELFSWDIVMR